MHFSQIRILPIESSSPSWPLLSSSNLSVAKPFRLSTAFYHLIREKAVGSMLKVFIFVTPFLLASAACFLKVLALVSVEKRQKEIFHFILSSYFKPGTERKIKLIDNEDGLNPIKDVMLRASCISDSLRIFLLCSWCNLQTKEVSFPCLFTSRIIIS